MPTMKDTKGDYRYAAGASKPLELETLKKGGGKK